MKKQLSVIVPVYNVLPYLEDCLQSILAQTFSDFELILVDDGSTDGSGDKCDDYAARDPRVRVVHQANGGLSAARNSGVALAQGEWLAFVDSDDLLPPTSFADMMACAREDVDVIIGKIASFVDTPNPLKLYGDNWAGLDLHGLTGLEALTAISRQSTIAVWAAWRNYVRRSFWNEINAAFPVGLTSEDVHLLPRVQMAARGIALCDACMYWYRLSRAQSITTGKNLKREFHFIQVIAFYRDYFREHPEHKAMEAVLLTCCGYYLYRALRTWGIYTKDEQRQLLAVALPHADWIKAHPCSKRWKPFFAILGNRLTYRLMMWSRPKR